MLSDVVIASNEKARHHALIQLNVIDSPYEAIFYTITAIACDVCGTPISLISLIDEKRQWFRSNIGIPGATHTDPQYTFCEETIKYTEILEVVGATQDGRFYDNPLVTGASAVRYYCGAPIMLPNGEIIGTLCVIDRQTNSLNSLQKKTLEGLAKLLSRAIGSSCCRSS